MAELAVFGSIMLLVLSFLVRYAITTGNQQQLQMDVFRTALEKAYWGVDRNETIVYRDFAMADPQDEYGVAARDVASASGLVTWEDPQEDPPEQAQAGGINYTFISGINNTVTYSKSFSTAGKNDYVLQAGGTIQNITVTYPFYDTEVIIPAATSRMIPYDTKGKEESKGDALQILVIEDNPGTNSTERCQTEYCPNDVITEVDIDNDGTTESILEAVGDTSGTLWVGVMDPNEGQIDATKGGLESQGPQLPKVVHIRKDIKGRFESNDQASVRTLMMLDDKTTHEYEIKLNKGGQETANITSVEKGDQWLRGGKN